MNRLTVVNQKGANIRIAPNTGAGIIRQAKAGTVLDYVLCPPPYSNGDVWAMLTSIDPETLRPWRTSSVGETSAFVAVYVGGIEFAKLMPDNSGEWNEALAAVSQAIERLKRI